MLLFVVILQLLGVLDAYSDCTYYYSYGYNQVGSSCTYYSNSYYYTYYRRVYSVSAPIIVVIALGALVGLGIFITILVCVCCRRGRRSTGVVVSGNIAQPTTGYIYPTNPNAGTVSYPGGNPPAVGYYGENPVPTGYNAGNAAPAGYYGGNAAPAGNYGDNQPINTGPKPPPYDSAVPS